MTMQSISRATQREQAAARELLESGERLNRAANYLDRLGSNYEKWGAHWSELQFKQFSTARTRYRRLVARSNRALTELVRASGSVQRAAAVLELVIRESGQPGMVDRFDIRD